MPSPDSVPSAFPPEKAQSAPAGLPPPYFLPRGVMPNDAGALPLSGLTVLLVEDSRFASDALRLMCQRSGARLRRAETIAQARAHLRTYRPDVVIVDLGLPDGRGDRLIRDLSMARQGSVLLGTSGDLDGRKAALAAGAVGFLEKPLSGLGVFQRAILRHMPGRIPILSEGSEDDLMCPDHLALQDDLAHAADLLATMPDGDQRGYLAAFLYGVARVGGDADLADVASVYGAGQGAEGPLRQALHARLDRGPAF